MDAVAVSEFLASFGALCGAPVLNVAELQAAAAWPLDGPELSNVYCALVKYLLAQWVSVDLSEGAGRVRACGYNTPTRHAHTMLLLSHLCHHHHHQQSHIESGHVGARVKRWARCLERSCSQGAAALAEAAADAGEYTHELLAYPQPNGNATWHDLLRRCVCAGRNDCFCVVLYCPRTACSAASWGEALCAHTTHVPVNLAALSQLHHTQVLPAVALHPACEGGPAG
jgi:hypothetical protein